MPDTNSLTARIEKLEIRIAFQDQNIEDLNTTITKQWTEIDKLKRNISQLVDQLRNVESELGGEGDQPPPHY